MQTNWKTVRDLTSGQAAEGAAAPSAFVSLEHSGPLVELHLEGGSFTGAPTSVTLGIWRSASGRKDKIGTWVITTADVGAPVPPLYEFSGGALAIKVESFVGGTAPTLVGTIEARAVFQ